MTKKELLTLRRNLLKKQKQLLAIYAYSLLKNQELTLSDLEELDEVEQKLAELNSQITELNNR